MSKIISIFFAFVIISAITATLTLASSSDLLHKINKKIAGATPPPFPHSSTVYVEHFKNSGTCDSQQSNAQVETYPTGQCIQKPIGFHGPVVFECDSQPSDCVNGTGYSGSDCNDKNNNAQSLIAPCATCANSAQGGTALDYLCGGLPFGIMVRSCEANSGCASGCNESIVPFRKCHSLSPNRIGRDVNSVNIDGEFANCRAVKINQYPEGSNCNSNLAPINTYSLASGYCFDGLKINCQH